MTFNEKYKDNIILKKSFEFAIKAVKYTEELESHKRFVLVNQRLKSGTSIGSNSKESQNAEKQERSYSQDKNCYKGSG